MIRFDYDENADVLYAFIDEPVKTYYEEVSNGVFLRRDYSSDRVIGFMIINYGKRKHLGLLHPIPNFEDVEIPY